MTPDSDHSAKSTLTDVARMAKTSLSTASKALNGRSGVSATTREAVLAAATQLGYLGTTGPTTRRIAFIADTFASLYTTRVLAGACREAALNDYELSAGHLDLPVTKAERTPLSPQWLRSIARDHVGLITVTTPLSSKLASTCRRLRMPCVAVDPRGASQDGVITLGATNWNGAVEATRHLIELGHRRIAYIGGSESSVPSFERYQGYLSALKDAGLPHDPALTRWGDFRFDSGIAHGSNLLALEPSRRPTAFVCASDWIALGVMDTALRRELRIPEDVSVTGYDDTEIADTSRPRMTSVRQPMIEMGAAAVHTIINLHTRGESNGPMDLRTTLIVRESTGPAPA